jgi:hypothetical protein
MRKFSGLPFAFLAALILLVGLACSVFGGATAAAPTTAPTWTPLSPLLTSSQPTPVPTSARFFTETFDAPASNWSLFTTQGDISMFLATVTDGRYVFEMLTRDMQGYAIYSPETYANVRLNVVAENRGDNEHNVTLVCRYSQKEGWYEFTVANTGRYAIRYGNWDRSGKTASYVILADGATNAIRVGKEINTYTFICNGRTLTALANDKEVREMDENRFNLRDGNLGIGVAAFQRMPIQVEFDSVQISEP